jgi:transcription antitermination factor NusG
MTPQSASFTQIENSLCGEEAHWFVATVKPQHEATVAQGLDLRGIEQFSPTYETRRAHERAERRILRRALFPGYVFCRFDRTDRTAVVKTPGVTSIVGFGGVAIPVPDEEVERVRAMVGSGFPVRPWPFLEAGARVRIEKGPLCGLEGIVVRQKDDYHLVVSVTFLRRSVAVSLDAESIAPLDSHRRFV